MVMAQWLISPLVTGLRWLAITEALDEFASFMMTQLDLRHEARNLDVFRDKFRDEPRVCFPRPLRESGEHPRFSRSCARVQSATS